MNRTLKISTHYRFTRSKEWGEKNRRLPAKDPSILLQGAWLRDAGFNPGQTAQLMVEEGKITIYSADTAEEQTQTAYRQSKNTFDDKFNSIKFIINFQIFKFSNSFKLWKKEKVGKSQTWASRRLFPLHRPRSQWPRTGRTPDHRHLQ